MVVRNGKYVKLNVKIILIWHSALLKGGEQVLKPNQIIKIKWHSQNKNHYISKGYTFTKYRDDFFVKAEDLSSGATAIVKVICDYCNEEYETPWYHYKESHDKNEQNACYNCRHKKRYKNNLI